MEEIEKVYVIKNTDNLYIDRSYPFKFTKDIQEAYFWPNYNDAKRIITNGMTECKVEEIKCFKRNSI
jgi:hypothetical protein